MYIAEFYEEPRRKRGNLSDENKRIRAMLMRKGFEREDANDIISEAREMVAEEEVSLDYALATVLASL